MNVEQLHKTTSKYDVVYKGKVIKLVLDPCKCGVMARWVMECKVKDSIPDMFKEMIPQEDLDKPVSKTIQVWHFEPNWFQRHILRYKLEDRLRKWVKKQHSELMILKESESQLENIMDKL